MNNTLRFNLKFTLTPPKNVQPISCDEVLSDTVFPENVATPDSVLENNSIIYIVKVHDTVDRKFDTGTDEERLVNAEKYFSFVLQNFRFRIRNLPTHNVTDVTTMKLTLISITTTDGIAEEKVLKNINETIEGSYLF
jgi:hypothetical protein